VYKGIPTLSKAFQPSRKHSNSVQSYTNTVESIRTL
jgi:hypothetical protein